MAEYHIGCGIAGIKSKKTKDGYQTWRNKSDVTEEAIAAVAQYFKQELKKNEISIGRRYTFNDGTKVELKLSIVDEDEE